LRSFGPSSLRGDLSSPKRRTSPASPRATCWLRRWTAAAHLEQVSVDPAYTGQQLGRLLVEQAVAWARGHDYPAITLTTFTDVAWNGPWYTRLGFSAVEPLTPGR